MELFDIDIALPPIGLPTDCAGYITDEAARQYGLPAKTPVYIGCNDFFAGLLGMGVLEEGTVFELSGTSEHLGTVTARLVPGAPVSGRYFAGFATYGGTKSSGVSCELAIHMFGIDDVTADTVWSHPPIFLPYLKGERAPIYDEKAKGVFFGITEKTTQREMAYAVLEGVVFSLYHIAQALQLRKVSQLIMGGGSAVNPVMAQLKAALFDCPVLRSTENDSSALGAAMLAMVGNGAFASVQSAAKALVYYETAAIPDPRLSEQLRRRYAIYRKLYEDLKDTFKEFANLQGESI